MTMMRDPSRVHNRSGMEKGEAPYEDPVNEGVPTLAEMTRGALNVLDADPDGFFLMIEGGAIDWAGHGNCAGRMIEEMRDFNNAVESVVEWVERVSSWDETLVIVTSDHETGYLTRRSEGDEIPDAREEITGQGEGALPLVQWNSTKHTNSLIPFYARGVGEHLVGGYVYGRDAGWQFYTDNTAISCVIKEAFAQAP
jgi:alkaline phosphatase